MTALQHSSKRAFVLIALVCACTPVIDPPWLITDTLDIGLRVEIERAGTFSLDIEDDPVRPYHQVLPRDSVLATPLLADARGPTPADAFNFRWVACSGSDCVPALANPQLGTCASDASFYTSGPCRLDDGPRTRMTLPDIPAPTSDSLFELVPPVALASIGSLREGPGGGGCAASLAARESLQGCFVFVRAISFGPASGVIRFAEQQGIPLDTDGLPASVLQQPRNTVPEIQSFRVRNIDRNTVLEVSVGQQVQVRVGDRLEVAWTPTAVDFDRTTITTELGTELEREDALFSSWWTTQRAEAFDFEPLRNRVTWTVGDETGDVFVIARASDSVGAESLGWLAFDVVE